MASGLKNTYLCLPFSSNIYNYEELGLITLIDKLSLIIHFGYIDNIYSLIYYGSRMHDYCITVRIFWKN